MAKTTSRSELQRLGKYRIVKRLASGGMSKVYRAVADGTGTEIALKVTPIENDEDVEIVDYQREVMMGRRLKHPNIISPIDHGCLDGHIFLTMPIVEGATLSSSTKLRDPSRKPSSSRSRTYRDSWVVPMLDGNWMQIAKIGVQLSSALVACHEEGIIHRDIKPSNIIMNRQGDVFLFDFGLAWMRRGPTDHKLATRAGTSRYLPPEVFRDRRDERSDIYSLGVSIHELVTGLKMWGHVDHETLEDDRPDYRVPLIRTIRKDVPRCLADCIDKAGADEPGERHKTAQQLETHFRQVLDELSRDAATSDSASVEEMAKSLASNSPEWSRPVESVWFGDGS